MPAPASASPTPAAGATPPFPAAARQLCVVLHDVAPARWAAGLRVLAQLRAVADGAGVDLPVSLLVVPRLHGDAALPAGYLRWLHRMQDEGHELLLHGWTHRDEQAAGTGWADHLRRHVYTAGEGEFAAIGEAEARRRLALGIDWARRLGLRVAGFVPPAWLISDAGWQALHAQPLRYACTLRHLVRLGDGARATAPALAFSTRAAWRRQASLAWNTALAWQAGPAPLLRLELHPHDADHGAVRDCWTRLLRGALRQRRPVTLAGAAATLWPPPATG